MELVFCSLDNSLDEYKEYVADMPWKCVPYDANDGSSTKDIRMGLAMKYGAQGIPHLVVLGPDRNVITKDGTELVQMDPEGANFPWKPKSFKEIMPAKFLTKDKGLVDTATLDDKYLMLYFSAHWCPPCRAFTPKLSAAYSKLMAQYGDQMEMMFVSSDRDEEAFQEYHGEMTFCALPFEERAAKQQLSKRFGIQGIPSLLILGPMDAATGERPLINDSLRAVIESGDFSEFPFYPKPYQELSTGADGINETPSLVVFCENEDDDEQEAIVKVVQELAGKRKDTHKFFYATQPGGAVGPVRKALGMEKKLDGVIVALVDIPDNGGFYVMPETKDDITVEMLESFLSSPGERQQMS